MASGELLLRNPFHGLLLAGVHARVALELLVLLGVERVLQLRADALGDLIVQRLIDGRRRIGALGLAGLLHQLLDALADFLAAVVAEFDGGQNFLFSSLLGAGFHHHDAALGARDHDADLGRFGFLVGGIRGQLAVDHADAHTGHHVLERNIGDGQRRTRAHDGERGGIAQGIGREHQADDLGFIGIAFGEQRADGAVDQTAGEGFLLRHAAFALDEAAGKTPGRVGVLAVIDGQGKEVGSGLGLRVGAGSHQDYRFAGAHDDRTIGLLGHLPGFEGDRTAAAQVYFNGMQHV